MSGSRPPVQESPGDRPTTIVVSRLHRQPGSLLDLSFEFPAPGELHVAMARVPEGSPIEMDVSVESVVEGIWVSGTGGRRRRGGVLEVLGLGGVEADGADRADVSISSHGCTRRPDRGVRRTTTRKPPRVVVDTIDLHEPLRDAVVLSLPLAPVVFPGLPGHLPHLWGASRG